MPHNAASPGPRRSSLIAALQPDARQALERIVSAAGDAAVYVVGGALRDALLGRPITDLDLAVEGDAAALAARAIRGARVIAHPRFLTASLHAGSVRIDLATCRRETYPHPGALPRVAPADIESDLRRRDFTINATALRLNGAAALIDPCGGQRDLQAGIVRVLHDRSFIDDPTRVFRAFRYAARLGFRVHPATRALLPTGVASIPRLSGERLRRELELTFGEEHAGEALEDAQDCGALAAIHHALAWDPRRTAGFASLRRLVPADPFGFALLAAKATPPDAESLVRRLRLKRAETDAVRGLAALAGAAATLTRRSAKPSGVVLLLDRSPPASVAAFAAVCSDTIAAQIALRYLEEWRYVKPHLNGRDLTRLGVPEGPHVQRGLHLIRAARLDGWASDRGDEEALVLRFAKSIRDSGRRQGAGVSAEARELSPHHRRNGS